jgi:exodeoxyribonuclease VII large subunit
LNPEKTIYTVSELTGEIKFVLENSYSEVTVIGEISNFKAHRSGHWYFTLKDADAVLNCTMWRGINNYVFFTPQEGMKVIASGRITVYPPRGSYQLDVRSMKPAGEGELQAAFERLKKKLAEEGLFDEQFKKPLPKFPEKIGIVTALDGAAFQDMINTAKRRYPLVELVIASAKVQGEGAAEEIADRIKALNKRDDIDVIIIGRGGGSLEDLWAFNEEVVARAVFESRIPVISGVGHEIDFSISDFVADVRAATPTAAMELATPDKEEIFAFIQDFFYNAESNILQMIENYRFNILNILNGYGFRLPEDVIKNKVQFLDNLIYKIDNGILKKLTYEKNRLALLNGLLEANNSDKILKKGYTIVKQTDKIIPRTKNFESGKDFKIKFYDGEVEIKR